MTPARRIATAVTAVAVLAPPLGTSVAGWGAEPAAVERAREHDAGRLLPETVAAFQAAREAGRSAGVELVITSGYRTPERQQELLEQAIEEHGSVEEAVRWVLPPDETDHVRGTAIDVGPEPAAAWLEANGAAFGLCRSYANEWWHFAYTPEAAAAGTCPPPAPTA